MDMFDGEYAWFHRPSWRTLTLQKLLCKHSSSTILNRLTNESFIQLPLWNFGTHSSVKKK